MNIHFKVVNVDEGVPEILTLMKSFNQEHVVNKRLGIKFNIDLEWAYSDFVRKNALVVLMYSGDKCIGCYAAILVPYFYNHTMKAAQEIIWCVHKDHQKTRATYYLIKYLDEVLPAYGVDIWHLAIPEFTEFGSLRKGLERLNYKPIETLYFKKV